MLNADARLLLLQLIEVNGGHLPRAAIQNTLQEMSKDGLIEAVFAAKQPKSVADHLNYKFKVTEVGKNELHLKKDRMEAAKIRSTAVRVLRVKKGRATVIEWEGDAFSLLHNHAGGRSQQTERVANNG